MSVQVEVINGVRVTVDGQPVKLHRQIQRLVAVLVSAGPAGIDDSVLAEELWVGDPPPRWNAAIRNAVTTLRAAVGPDTVTTAGGRYSLQCATADVDAWQMLASPPSAGELHNSRLQAMDRFVPFDGLSLTPLLRETYDALLGARVQLIKQVASTDHVDPAVVAGLLASVRIDPFAQPTAVAVVDMLGRINRVPEALQLLDEIEQAYRNQLHSDPPVAIVTARSRAGEATS